MTLRIGNASGFYGDRFDAIVLDPPKFAPTASHAERAARAYKDINRLRRFVNERGKILPRRMSGNCAKHQRQLSEAIKRARAIALLPYTVD